MTLYSLISTTSLITNGANDEKTSFPSSSPNNTNNNARVLVHGYPSDIHIGKQALKILAQTAFKEATQLHHAISLIPVEHVPILPFEFYNQLNTPDLIEKIFITGFALMYANADNTSIELLECRIQTEWYYYKYVTQKKVNILRVFTLRAIELMPSLELLNVTGASTDEAARTTTTLSKDTVPIPPPISLYKSQSRENIIGNRDKATKPHTAFASTAGVLSPAPITSTEPNRYIALLPASIEAELKDKLRQRRVHLDQSTIEEEHSICTDNTVV